MSRINTVLISFIAGAAVGAIAATLIDKEEREKIANNLKEKASSLKEKLEAELSNLNSQSNSNKTV